MENEGERSRLVEQDRARWARVESAVLQWVEQSGRPGDRLPRPTAAQLEELCGPDRDLQRQVERLLGAWGVDGDLLSGDLSAGFEDLLLEVREDLESVPREKLVGRTIDRYRLLGVLGHGGMGVVYEAARADDSFDKRVALKVMPRGLETPEKERRFLVERQVLARLQHPHIAGLLDGGVTDEGFPYLVMELVEGEPIDVYCEQRQLALRARVELLLDVCRAVHYAHQNLVIHRDLKPANVMVTKDGDVKLLDFGVAKMLDAPEADAATRMQPMTPRFAAPEQRQNRPVSTVTDVYSLGVLLSGLVDGIGDDRDAALASEVAVIAARAQREDPEQRFPSAAEMAEDLRRALAGRPIESRPSTWHYRLRRAVARNRRATVVGASVAVLVTAGLLLVSRQTSVARQERDRARVEAERTEQVSTVLTRLFADANPYSNFEGERSAEELLLRGAERVQRELADQPALRGAILSVLASSLSSLGQGDRAWELSALAVRDLRRAMPVDSAALARALRVHAALALDLARSDASAEELLGEALRLLDEVEPPDSALPERANIERHLGRAATLAGRSEAAVEHHRRSLAILEQIGLAADSAIQRTHLAASLRGIGEDDLALEHDEQALRVLMEEFGAEHPNVASLLNNLAVTAIRRARYSEAEDFLRSALGSSEQTFGPDHPVVASQLTNLGRVLIELGRFDEAAAPLRRAVEIRRRTTGPDGPNRLGAEVNLARLQYLVGDHDDAVAALRDALLRFERQSGERSLAAARTRSLLAEALRRRGAAGDASRAESLVRSALESYGQAQAGEAPTPVPVADALVTLGRLLVQRNRLAEAMPVLRRALAVREHWLVEDCWQLAEVRLVLAHALVEADGPASEVLAEARSLVESTRESDLVAAPLSDLRRLRGEVGLEIEAREKDPP